MMVIVMVLFRGKVSVIAVVSVLTPGALGILVLPTLSTCL